jgi:hypothetical protein
MRVLEQQLARIVDKRPVPASNPAPASEFGQGPPAWGARLAGQSDRRFVESMAQLGRRKDTAKQQSRETRTNACPSSIVETF